jgi:hypothetical protein
LKRDANKQFILLKEGKIMALKGLEWLPREDGTKDHALHTSVHWGTQAPCTVYEKRPLKDRTARSARKAWLEMPLGTAARALQSY